MLSAQPFRWVSAPDLRVYEVGIDVDHPADLGSIKAYRPTGDDPYDYRVGCVGDCQRSTSFGPAVAVQRVDRRSGEVLDLSRRTYGIAALLERGDYIYWGIYGHGIGGGVSKVLKSGAGEQETFWKDWRFQSLEPYADGILAIGESRVGWIPDGSEEPSIVYAGEMGTAIVDGDDVFIADHGDPYWKAPASGAILRAARRGGSTETLVAPIKWPSAIAVRGDLVYYMLKDSDAIWAVPRRGGTASIVMPEVFTAGDAGACGRTDGMWSTPIGIYWTRSEFMGRPTSLYFVPWSGLTS